MNGFMKQWNHSEQTAYSKLFNYWLKFVYPARRNRIEGQFMIHTIGIFNISIVREIVIKYITKSYK